MKNSLIRPIVFATMITLSINSSYCQPVITFNKIFSSITNDSAKNILANFTNEQKKEIELSVYKNVVLPIIKLKDKDEYLGLGSDHWIDQNYDGEIIKLEDGSIWEVLDMDVYNSMLWLPVDNIKIKKSKNPLGEYVFMMKNEDDETPVSVKLLKQ